MVDSVGCKTIVRQEQLVVVFVALCRRQWQQMVIRQPWEMSVQTVVQTRRPAFGDRGIQISCNSSFGGKISLVFILIDLIIFESTNSKSLFIQSFRQSRAFIQSIRQLFRQSCAFIQSIRQLFIQSCPFIQSIRQLFRQSSHLCSDTLTICSAPTHPHHAFWIHSG